MNLYFKPNKNFSIIPGSKSITNRFFLFSLLCKNQITKIWYPLLSQDTIVMLKSIGDFGVNFKLKDGIIFIFGIKKVIFFVNKFFFENAGTVSRPLLFFFLLLKRNRNLFLDGNYSMRKRPIKGIIDIILSISKDFCIGDIIYIGEKYHFPILLKKNCFEKDIRNFLFLSNSISSQYLTSFLIFSFFFIKKRKLLVVFKNIVSFNYVKLTLLIAKGFNICFLLTKRSILLFNSFYFSPFNFYLEKDIVSISYLIFRSYILNKKFFVSNCFYFVHSEKYLINVLKKLGFFFYFYKNLFFSLKYNSFNSFKYLKVNCYSIIDSSMFFNNFFMLGFRKIKLYNIYNWRFKECNRIFALSKELKKFGFKVFYGLNWMVIQFYKKRCNFVVNTYNDHRIAMSIYNFIFFTKVFINNPNCVKKTFPNFFK